MQKMFTAKNMDQRQQTITDLIQILDQKHDDIQNHQRLQRKHQTVRSVPEGVNDELLEVRQQLSAEIKMNNSLRAKVRKKNRELKIMHSRNRHNPRTANGEENDGLKTVSVHSVLTDHSHSNVSRKKRKSRIKYLKSIQGERLSPEEKENGTPSAFQLWCMNMGCQQRKIKCSLF